MTLHTFAPPAPLSAQACLRARPLMLVCYGSRVEALAPIRRPLSTYRKITLAATSSCTLYSKLPATQVQRQRHQSQLPPLALTTFFFAHFHSFHTSVSSCNRAGVSPFKLHDIGEGITEVEVLRWYVTEGQQVAEFDALCEVQSDKSVVELTSHATGTVRGIKVEAGKMVKVGQVLCEIYTDAEGEIEGEMGSEGDGDSGASQPVVTAQTAEDVPLSGVGESEAKQATREGLNGKAGLKETQNEAICHAEELSESLEKAQDNIQSSHTTTSTQTERVAKRHPLAESEDDGQQNTDGHHHEHQNLFDAPDDAADSAGPTRLVGEASILPNSPSSSSRGQSQQIPQYVEPRRERTTRPDDIGGNRPNGQRVIIKASPAVRTLATRLGVDLAKVDATGPSGRITKEDIEAFAPRSTNTSSRSGAGGEAGLVRYVERDLEPDTRRIEFGRTRKVMYRALGAQGSIPHFGYSHTLNLTPSLPYLKISNANADPTHHSKSKPNYQASDIPQDLVRDPLAATAASAQGGAGKTTILTFLVKALVLALEEHPIMRSRVREASEGGERWLEVNRDPVVGVAVSDPKYGLLTPSLPPLSPSTPLSTITSLLHSLRHAPNRPSTPANLTISSVGGLGEARGAMPVLPPGGGLAICAVGRAAWEMEWVARDGLRHQNDHGGRGDEVKGKNVWELDEGTVEKSGAKAVLRAPVGWSGDHRVVSLD
ncbi:hypothetical protein I316_03393 [Kwoniella heveanensis BCC8398]|uniref:Dihydrolipoamide acetyltransferase component of pyruvate dehydrogenase complex n=1 Tax=Kwoniella heveanensis BCC8398 TaxID=1296120 RepID=A0A1B9GUZ5_9TREE|nr:hypothetical protein I316_03393 [Kwoniella heveanensis BCC8398]